MKILGIFFLACAAPIVIAAQQSEGTSAQAPAPQSTQPGQSTTPAAKATMGIDPAKEAAIRRLFDVQDTKDAMRQVLTGMSRNIRPMLESSLPPGEYRAHLIDLFFERFLSKMSVDQLLELAIPVYDKYFSLEDIDGLTKFYQTPLGRKTISVLPQVLMETQAAGMNLGEQVGRQAMKEVLDEHPDLKKSLEDAAAAPKN